ncbi:hypothetical protein [Alterisphingorhabdus coralli]|uniref:Uncharacterized protein n=1 Tax=Alterisphingorhabdus coralli TaxID=3071408 RepID=A0AA97FA14_9SPHN|nr:hypothetical protein [Parasphingorhabdus sp. SCSIO 66989]WOE76311.1 hypothetical protein RB602_06260 [Parasphingorhabdus sp. SCSIO 66989]
MVNKIAAFLFWGFFGTIGVVIGLMYISGGHTERNPRSCEEGWDSVYAAEREHLKRLAVYGRDDDYERTSERVMKRASGGWNVSLFTKKGNNVYAVKPDCSVSFIMSNEI